ncbi:hypothetical protein V5S96_10245 [Corynebacterium mastitidis]|uniref:Phage tail tape measure protein n=1 Tax=Corynebacterium mastitidis TaxID=161890 RepID=A0ABU8P2K6_9CORY
MSKTAILSVRIISDAKKAVAGFNEAGRGLDKLESGMKKAAAVGTAATAAVVGMGKQALDSASKLQQSTGAVESVFKAQSGAIKTLAADAANAVGLSKNQYQEFASVMGSQLKNLGVAQSDLVPTTDKLITMGADLASMYGGTTADAVEALSAAFRGETDPIEKYGISIKKSDINARLAAQGLDKLEGEALKQAETQALLAMLTEQSADAQGNFARETDTAAGSAQIAAAHWENAKAALGEQLLPYATQAAEAMAKLAQKIGENPEAFRALAIAIGVTTGALYTGLAAIKAWRIASAIATAVSTAWGAMTGRIVFGNTIAAGSSATAASTSMAAWLGAAARTVAGWVAAGARIVWTWISTAAQAVIHAGAAAGAWIASGVRAAGAWLAMQIRAGISFTMTAASAAMSATMTAASWLAAGARAAGAWLAMQIRAGIAFAMTAASAVGAAAATAAAWVASSARAIGAFVAQQAAMMAVRAATLAMAAAQWVLNAAMSANPIGIVIVAVTALVAALVLAYQKSETFRNAVNAAGRVGKAAFDLVVGGIRSAVSWVGNIISKVGGVGGAFRAAMAVASAAVSILTAPLRGLVSLIGSVISAIGRIRFPSPPSWLSKMFAAAPEFTTAPAAPFRFMSPPALSFGYQPELTAASGSLSSLRGAIGSSSGGAMKVDNSVHITVDGSGVVDPRAIVEALTKALKQYGRDLGLASASGGGGFAWA